MVLIVNTTKDTSISEEIRRNISDKGIDAEIIEAGEMRISHCIGCNFCWLKTPGECSVKDDYEQILRKIIHANQMWVISDTALGFIDHKGKNIFDRILPIATMYLTFKGDQMRHVRRYKNTTDIGLIYKGDVEKDFLSRWNERAALNFHSKSLGVFSTDEIKEAASCMC